jgi:hypothetical protein
MESIMSSSGADLVAKLPGLEDSGLAALHENAARLQQSGTPAQKSAASALVPAIEAELAARREAKLAASKRRRKEATPKRTKKAQPAAD